MAFIFISWSINIVRLRVISYSSEFNWNNNNLNICIWNEVCVANCTNSTLNKTTFVLKTRRSSKRIPLPPLTIQTLHISDIKRSSITLSIMYHVQFKTQIYFVDGSIKNEHPYIFLHFRENFQFGSPNYEPRHTTCGTFACIELAKWDVTWVINIFVELKCNTSCREQRGDVDMRVLVTIFAWRLAFRSRG